MIFHQGDCVAPTFCTVACFDRLSLTCDAFAAQRSHLHSKMAIAVMKTTSDPYRTDRSNGLINPAFTFPSPASRIHHMSFRYTGVYETDHFPYHGI